jgi:hypothetical protein
VTLLAYSRAFWPLFLHVLGAMTLVGLVLGALVLSLAGQARRTLVSLLVSLPAWALTLGAAYWLEHDEGLGNSNATWLGIGHGVLEPGLIVLLVAIGAAYWWSRSGRYAAARISTFAIAVYLVLLTVALLAMSGKWG